MRHMTIAALAVLTIGHSASAGGVLFVDDDAAGGGDGLGWDTAYRFLQDALTFASDPANGITEIRDWDGDSIVDDGERETRDHSFINDMYERVIIKGATGGGDLTLDVDNDPAGNVTDEDIAEGSPNNFALLYTHDAWHRLVKVEIRDEDGTTIDPRGEYEYNGLNWCIEKRSDSDVTDGTNALNEQRMRFYNAEWQMIEERVDDDAGGFPAGPGDSDNDRHERLIWGAQGINDIILHGSDTNKDGDLNDVYYHLCDPQLSTVAIIDDAAKIVERTSFSPYGVGRHHRLADLDGDGDTDTGNPSDDKLLTDNLGNPGVGDLNRSGKVTTADGTILTNDVGAAEPFGAISNSTVDNQIGYAGYVFNEETQHYLARNRWYHPQLGRWLQRDPAGYVDGMSLYEYVRSRPTVWIDPLGLKICRTMQVSKTVRLADRGLSTPWIPIGFAGMKMKHDVREGSITIKGSYQECGCCENGNKGVTRKGKLTIAMATVGEFRIGWATAGRFFGVRYSAFFGAFAIVGISGDGELS